MSDYSVKVAMAVTLLEVAFQTFPGAAVLVRTRLKTQLKSLLDFKEPI